jgi:hypothetical protein
MWRLLVTHSIILFPLHFSSRASPCAVTFQLDSTTDVTPQLDGDCAHRTNREYHLSLQTHRRHFVWFDGKQPWITCTVICKSWIIIQSSIWCLVRQSTKSHMLCGCYSRHVTSLSSLVIDMTHDWFVYIPDCVWYLKISRGSYFLRQTCRWQQFSEGIPHVFLK